MRKNTIELLDEAIEVLEKQGVRVRNELLGDTRSGLCRLGKNYQLILDLSQPATEQLPFALSALIELDIGEELISDDLASMLANHRCESVDE